MKEYVMIDNYKVGRWRCPECYRGLVEKLGCVIHGNCKSPVDILESEEARKNVLEMRRIKEGV